MVIRHINFAPYEDARDIARASGITSKHQYIDLAKNDHRLPTNPDRVYALKGWTNWRAFLGKEPRAVLYNDYSEAQASTLKLEIKSCIDYQQRHSEDPRLPASPYIYYRDRGWISWGYFLNKINSKFYETLEEARCAAKSLNANSKSHYKTIYKLDSRLPYSPDKFYALNGWNNWDNFLGIKPPIRYGSYVEAKEAALSLGVRTVADYHARRKQDPLLPYLPSIEYADRGWQSWGKFLNKQEQYSSYEEAQQAAQKLGVKSQPKYRKRYIEDPCLPCNPDNKYAGRGWKGWQIFLGIRRAPIYPEYSEARLAVKNLGIKSILEYEKRYKENPSLPSNPNERYKKSGWVNWYDFLSIIPRYTDYSDAKKSALQLGCSNKSEYKRIYRVDPKLPCSPDIIYGQVGWEGWPEFLGLTLTYESYEQSSCAAQRLGIKQAKEYHLRYNEDPKLPKHPSSRFKGKGWTCWEDYLGADKRLLYRAYEDAKASVINLGISSRKEYTRRRHEDTRLPACPDGYYSGVGWTNYYDFFGTQKSSFYESLAEAQEAASKLNIRTREQYNKEYRKDPKLPACPMRVYESKGWTNWPEFFGRVKKEFYSEYLEARAATQKLGITSTLQYQREYRNDTMLPVSPHEYYAGCGWIDWYDYLGSHNRSIDVTPRYPNIWSAFCLWLEDETHLSAKRSSMKSFLANFYGYLNYPDDVRYLLLRGNPIDADSYQRYIDSVAESRRPVFHNSISAFYKWALRELCTDEDGDERVVLPGCRNPFDSVLSLSSEELKFEKPNQTVKPPLAYEYILRCRNYLVPNCEDSLLTRPKLRDMMHLLDLFNTKTDWLEVPESSVDTQDPHCVWRTREVLRVIDKKKVRVTIYQIWSPARFIAFYTLLRYPIRGQQILWLDSGEGDTYIPLIESNGSGIKWHLNTSHLVGMQLSNRGPQGALRQGVDGNTRIYMTTNKTGRTEGGYDVDWIPDDLVYWFIVLREWQQKFNPLSEPTRWLDIINPEHVNKKILKSRGSQNFLFRMAGSGQPITTTAAFMDTLPAVLFQVQRSGEDLAQRNPEPSPHKFTSIYTPHTLRVSLITAYIVDGEAPIHIVSKLVGHTSLVMTIYYVKLTKDQMRHAMGEAEKRAQYRALQQQASLVRSSGLEPLRSQLIATDGNRPLFESDIPGSACIVFDWGICPMSACSCHIGAENSSASKSEITYIPVESGYLGKKNCLRCRFFVTGVPFLGSMIALANEIALEIHAESARYQAYSNEVSSFENQHYDCCQRGQPFLQADALKLASANMQQSADKLDTLLTDYSAAVHYSQASLKIINQEAESTDVDDEIKLIVASQVPEMELSFEESNSNYHLLSEICHNATIYRSSNPSRALPLISIAIDRMAENNNLKPAMFRLNDKQKLVVANQLNSLLLQRLGSWERIDDLFSGDLMLLDIDAHQPNLSRISRQIKNLLSQSDATNVDDRIISYE